MPKAEISLDVEFASTMQQLVAEAEKASVPPAEIEDVPASEIRNEFAGMNARLTGLERTISERLEKVAAAVPASTAELAKRLEGMAENLDSLRNTETVNQRLFNSLHDELKNYRDNFLRESLQKPFIRDLLVLFDDLTSLATQMESARAGAEGRKGKVAQWCANLENALHSVVEILHRMEVTEIEAKDTVDRVFHRVVSYEPADFVEEDGQIVMRVKRGFLWRDHVLRPEEVVAKRFG